MSKLIIAIDGPSGAGKSCCAKMLAKELGYTYLDTGALYRVIAFAAYKKKIDWQRSEALKALLSSIKIKVVCERGEGKILLDGKDYSSEIRSPEVSMVASYISQDPLVRRALFDIQRGFGEKGGVVIEGRDIGTVIFPDADIKFFLTASLEERAKRRYLQLRAQGWKGELEEIKKETEIRDREDSERGIAPLKPAREAIIIDSTSLNKEEVVKKMLEVISSFQDGLKDKRS
jgi:cytidylate kinase